MSLDSMKHELERLRELSGHCENMARHCREGLREYRKTGQWPEHPERPGQGATGGYVPETPAGRT